MSTALYRRYRPETFADVIGQEHVTEPLMQALRTGRVGHAYLFSGPRGCGKTTSARILARCLNCAAGPTPTPCGTCDSCVALARGGAGTVDVIEIDAASHGGVDDARDLRERASYGPAQSRYKIYIIDEAHMVTSQGFNALLKIVEEPPEHVKFIFATTEPEKVIGTIRSRTHHYPFRLVPPARLQAYTESLCRQEGVAVAPGVLSFVVRAGGGSVRDSLSVLDQLIAGSGDEGLTYESAAALLGFTDSELLDATIEALSAADAAAVFRAIDRVVETGLDPRRFVEDLLERLRDLIVVEAIQEGAGQVLRHLPEDQIERMRRQASAFGAGALSRAADIVNSGLTEMTGATAPRLQLELIAARVLLPGAAGEAGYAARLDRLERRLEVGGVPSAAAAPAAPPSFVPPAPPVAAATPPAVAVAPALPPDAAPPVAAEPSVTAPVEEAPVADSAPVAAEASAPRGPGGIDTDALRRSWPDVLAKLFEMRRGTWTLVSQNAQIAEYDGSRLLLALSTTGLADAFRRGPHAEYVRQALIDVLGVDARVEGVPGDVPALDHPAPSAAGAADPEGEHRPDPGPPAPGPAADPAAFGVVASSSSRGQAPSWSDAPPPPDSAPAWASPLEQAKATVAEEIEQEQVRAPRVVDDTAISDDDESIDDLTDVGLPVVERILGGTVIREDPR
ncbi:DNA polymerase III subunit gamma and tau [Phycicoccus duodecadis]|uniref:DNA polymerase III subunit gamma and tau n=1 Tax=Phycicoccus duodecadis TaxID=173053 RepID=UPI000C70DD45|nr:DNA polymerase III subunit gamma and tau [Phycicoccus duodecadis]